MPVVLVLPLDLIFKRTASERKIKSKKRNETKRDLPHRPGCGRFSRLKTPNARVVEWQTRTFEGRMPKGMRVQVPPRAPNFSACLSLGRIIVRFHKKAETDRNSLKQPEEQQLMGHVLCIRRGINLSGENQSVRNRVGTCYPGNSRLEIGQVGAEEGCQPSTRNHRPLRWPPHLRSRRYVVRD